MGLCSQPGAGPDGSQNLSWVLTLFLAFLAETEWGRHPPALEGPAFTQADTADQAACSEVARGPDGSARAGGGRLPQVCTSFRACLDVTIPSQCSPAEGGSRLNLRRWPEDKASVSASPFRFAVHCDVSELSAFEPGEECWQGHAPPLQGRIFSLPTSGFLFLHLPWQALPERPMCCRWWPGQAPWRARSPWFLSPDTVTDRDIWRVLGFPRGFKAVGPLYFSSLVSRKTDRGPRKGEGLAAAEHSLGPS